MAPNARQESKKDEASKAYVLTNLRSSLGVLEKIEKLCRILFAKTPEAASAILLLKLSVRIAALQTFLSDPEQGSLDLEAIIQEFVTLDTDGVDANMVLYYEQANQTSRKVVEGLKALAGETSQPLQRRVAEAYKSYQILVKNFGRFSSSERSFSENNLQQADTEPPDIVRQFQEKLDIRLNLQALDEEPKAWLEGKTDREALERYVLPAEVDPVRATQQPTPPSREVSRLEVLHIMSLANINWPKAWDTKSRQKFKELEAYAAVLYPFFLALSETKKELKVNRCRESWPLHLIMCKKGDNGEDEYRKYKPQSDLAIFLSNTPRFVLEVNSGDGGEWPEDLVRMILSGSVIVRLANTESPKFRDKKDFVLPAVYLGNRGEVRSFFLYQQEEGDEVYWFEEDAYQLDCRHNLVRFARRLYSLAHALSEDAEDKDMLQFIKDYNHRIGQARFKTFNSKGTKRQNDDGAAGGDVHDKKSRRDESGGNAGDEDMVMSKENEELREHGYEVFADVIDLGKGCIAEPLFELPSNVCNVRDLSGQHTEIVAKKVRKDSDETRILKLLDGQPGRQHIIPVYDIINTLSTTWLILPKLTSIRQVFLFETKRYAPKAAQMCWNLLEGMACLHRLLIAHRDIKPDNLVIDHTESTIKIIDFDLAIQLGDEDEEVEEHCGTEGWEAPELVEGAQTVSPIKCDRWACGAVIRHILKELGRVDKRLDQIAEQLMAKNPQDRPSLLPWHLLGLRDGEPQGWRKREVDVAEEQETKKARWEGNVGQGYDMGPNVGQVEVH